MFLKISRICIIVILISACSEDEPERNGLTAYDESVIEYFNEIALGFEFGSASEVTRKWKNDMKIFVGGTKTTDNDGRTTACYTRNKCVGHGWF